MSRLRWARRLRGALLVLLAKRNMRQGGLKGETGEDVKGRAEEEEVGEERQEDVEMMIIRMILLMSMSLP